MVFSTTTKARVIGKIEEGKTVRKGIVMREGRRGRRNGLSRKVSKWSKNQMPLGALQLVTC